jgi:hypothetical protein
VLALSENFEVKRRNFKKICLGIKFCTNYQQSGRIQ